MVVLAITFVAFCNHVTAKKPTPQVDLANDLLRMCSGSNPIASARQKKELTWLVEASGKPSLVLSTSPQHQAACWVLYQDRKQSKGRGRDLFLQRYALATLHFATTKTNTTVWDWRMTVDEPWAEPVRGRWMSTRHHECDWYGVNCAMFGKQVKRLILGYMKLDGIIPREIYLLPKLKELDLHGNDFQGVLPLKMVDALHNLEYLYLHMNGFFGSLHREIKGLKSLRELRIFGNYFAGSIPGPEIASLKNLQIIDLYANFLTGTIPTELGSLKSCAASISTIII